MGSEARVQSVDRALEMLEFIETAGRHGTSLSEVSKSLNLSRSATWTTLQTLQAHGFVAETSVEGRSSYTLGMSLARLGHRAQSQFRLNDIATPHLRTLTERTGLTSRLVVLHGGSAIVVSREDSPGAVQFNLHLGQPELLHSSSVGKALLSSMQETIALELLLDLPLEKRTSRTITDVEELMSSLEGIRRRGYSVDDEEDADGVVCIGASIVDFQDLPVGAISVTGLKQALSVARIEEVGALVANHAHKISVQLSPRRRS